MREWITTPALGSQSGKVDGLTQNLTLELGLTPYCSGRQELRVSRQYQCIRRNRVSLRYYGSTYVSAYDTTDLCTSYYLNHMTVNPLVQELFNP